MNRAHLRSLRALRPSRTAWLLGSVAAVYLALGWLLGLATRTEGLLTPQGAPNGRVVALAVAYMVLRVVVRFGAPFALTLLTLRGLVSVWRRAADARRASDPR